MDQAERFNAFNFNNFEGWSCNAGYSGLIIREPDGSVKRSYSPVTTYPLVTSKQGLNSLMTPMPCITDSCVSKR
jgi:hypothetical protein